MSRTSGTWAVAAGGGAFLVTVSFLVPLALLRHIALVLAGAPPA